MISRSYWPSTRVDIQPSIMPTSAPANFWATGASGSAAHPFAELVDQRAQQTLERRDVGARSTRPGR